MFADKTRSPICVHLRHLRIGLSSSLARSPTPSVQGERPKGHPQITQMFADKTRSPICVHLRHLRIGLSYPSPNYRLTVSARRDREAIRKLRRCSQIKPVPPSAFICVICGLAFRTPRRIACPSVPGETERPSADYADVRR